MSQSISECALSIKNAIKIASEGLIERESLADLIVLAAVASEHLLVIGPPGTAKSAVVRHVSKAIGGRYFEYLLGRFTEPSEIFGPIDLKKLREGTIETETSNMLPEAEVAFLDEVFLGSTAVLNTLLGVLNERMFRRGHTLIKCPLRVCVGASNALPEDESLAAFADRFLIHSFIDSTPDSLLEELLEGGWKNENKPAPVGDTLAQLDILTKSARQANLEKIRPSLAHCIRVLRKAGVILSDRRVVKTQSLITAAAALAGRDNPTDKDLWPLIYVIPTCEGQQTGREVLSEVLEISDNITLNAATEEASFSPVSRSNRLCEMAEKIIRQQPQQEHLKEHGQWRLKLESIGREIDSGFDLSVLPENLRLVRENIISLTGAENINPEDTNVSEVSTQ